MITKWVSTIVDHSIKNDFINKEDKIYFINIISGVLGVQPVVEEPLIKYDIADILNKVGDNYSNSKIESDRIIDFIMGIILPTSKNVNDEFWKRYEKQLNPITWFHNLSTQSYYIKYDRLKKNLGWSTHTKYGDLEITINLAKPEKNSDEIAKALREKSVEYPKCVLCFENQGFFGNAKRASRQNIRFVKYKLNNSSVFMHFSPYEYIDHHLIVNSMTHTPIIINDNSYKQLLDFVDLFPDYFIGSNTDIPIVGGSILSHSHYQAGRYSFPLFKAKSMHEMRFNDVNIEILNWPLSIIKLTSRNRKHLFKMCSKINNMWHKYENKELNIISKKDGERQNAITPIVRKINNSYEIYLALRNNATSKKYPGGVFHVHQDVWNIKKENIGVIEVAGKAILPGRLVSDMVIIKKCLIEKKELPSSLKIHKEWFKLLKSEFNGNDVDNFINKHIAYSFRNGLEDCGLFKNGNIEPLVTWIKEVLNDFK